jgi:hypothetical protein
MGLATRPRNRSIETPGEPLDEFVFPQFLKKQREAAATASTRYSTMYTREKKGVSSDDEV